MHLIVKNDEKELVAIANKWCEEKFLHYQAKSIYLPAGNTPTPLYRYWEKTKPAYLNNILLQQMDEVMEGPKQNCFAIFFKKELPNYEVRAANAEPILQADLGIFGLGKNGHVAFHEPGMPADFTHGALKLSKQSSKTLGIVENTNAISYGLGSFLKTKAALLIVSGKSKKTILKKLLKKDPSLPASLLLAHKDLTILADTSAFGT